MIATHRLAEGGRIDRTKPLRFTFDGQQYTGLAGDSLASALLANGVHTVTRSVRYGRPRGVFAAGVEEPNALVQLEGPHPEPMLLATRIELYEGLVARSLIGKGCLEPDLTAALYDRMYAHCDVLVVGAGPAGLAAAYASGRSGARVILIDDLPELGGSLLGTRDLLDGAPALEWVQAVGAEFRSLPEVRVLSRTTAVGSYDHNLVLAVERRTEHLGPAAPAGVSRQRVWHVRARQVVLATGAHERPIVFGDNDRPGVMLAGAARTYVNRYGVRPGTRALVATTNDSAYPAALELADAGLDVALIVDARPEVHSASSARCAARGIEVLAGHAPVGTDGDQRVGSVRVAALGQSGEATAAYREVACDLLLVSGGWNPVMHLFSQAQGKLRFDEELATFVPEAPIEGQRVAGSARGVFALDGCLADGAAAGFEAAWLTGHGSRELLLLPAAHEPPPSPPRALWHVRAPGDARWDTHFVDLQRDATVADVLRATGAGMRSVEHVKRYTTIGTAHDQGKTSGILATAVVADALRSALADVGTTTFRPPYVPVGFAALGGRDRGPLYDPVRVTPLHRWHVAHGALFENVGQWKRPWYYPRPGEDMEAAVLRECRAARESVALMDASTLGKIDVQGPDAAEFLDRVYTNLVSTLKVGSIRYGVMCRADGMVFDDGTIARLAEDRFLITTTTGNAAAVLEWLEEWLQTEWPGLGVHLTSVTDHWATIALVGPRSREVLALAAPGLAVDKDSFPFMTWRDATVAGAPARICRISFSGELAYEVNVVGWEAPEAWDALVAAGGRWGITPYGTETMHVLRAEKGFIIAGQDTDGTVTPQDLGMEWVVSKKKRDFIGRRSFARADTSRPDRKQLVGLLPVQADELLPEGAQVIVSADVDIVPVPMLGHVTSSYRSAALGRTFALALVRRGRERIGETLFAWSEGVAVPATVTEPIFYDPEGARRDG